MGMDYATKELTASLQQITIKGANVCNKSFEHVASAKNIVSMKKLTLSDGVNEFLATRKDFQERTRDVSVGSY